MVMDHKYHDMNYFFHIFLIDNCILNMPKCSETQAETVMFLKL